MKCMRNDSLNTAPKYVRRMASGSDAGIASSASSITFRRRLQIEPSGLLRQKYMIDLRITAVASDPASEFVATIKMSALLL